MVMDHTLTNNPANNLPSQIHAHFYYYLNLVCSNSHINKTPRCWLDSQLSNNWKKENDNIDSNIMFGIHSIMIFSMIRVRIFIDVK